MGLLTYAKDLFTLASIFGLIGLGLFITLRSGVVSLGRERCRLIFGNLSRLVVAVSAGLVVLMMVQQIVGLRIGSPW